MAIFDFDFSRWRPPPSWIFEISIFWTVETVKRVELHLHARFRQNRLNGGRDVAIFYIFQDGVGRHLGFGLFTQNAQGWQDVTRQIPIIYVLNINNQHLKKTLYSKARFHHSSAGLKCTRSCLYLHMHLLLLFGIYFSSLFGTLAIRWHPRRILRRSSQGNPSFGGI